MCYLFEFSFSHISGAKIIKNNGKRKTENGKLYKFFDFCLEWENGTDAKPNAEAACRLCLGAKEEKPAKQG